MKNSGQIKNNKGFSLISVMVASGILLMVMSAFATYVTSQAQIVHFLEQMLDKQGMQSILMAQFYKTDVCTWQFADPIDVSGATADNPSPTVISLQKLHLGADENSPILFEVGTQTNSGLVIESIELKNFIPIDTNGNYMSTLFVSFADSPGWKTLQPLQIDQQVHIAGSDPTAMTIDNCSGASGSVTLAACQGIDTTPMGFALPEVVPGWSEEFTSNIKSPTLEKIKFNCKCSINSRSGDKSIWSCVGDWNNSDYCNTNYAHYSWKEGDIKMDHTTGGGATGSCFNSD